MSLERVRCTLCDVRSGRSISTSLAIHQSMITNIRIWCTKAPEEMELFMTRDKIEAVQKDLLPDYDFEPIFISADHKQVLLSSHDKISSYLKTLDIPYNVENGLSLYIRIVRNASGKRRILMGPVRDAVRLAPTNRRLTRPISDGSETGTGQTGPGTSSASGWKAYTGTANTAGQQKARENPLRQAAKALGETRDNIRKAFRKNRKLLRRLAVPAAILALYLFFCLVGRPALMQGLYASGQYGGEVFLYNSTSPWCLPGQKGITRLAEQQIDALYIQASPYERNAAASLIKLTAFKSISNSDLARKAGVYTDRLSQCLKDLDVCQTARKMTEEGRYTDAILLLRRVEGDSLVIGTVEDLRYACYDRMVAGIQNLSGKEAYEEALARLDQYLAELEEDQTIQWTRDETARGYESLIIEEAEDLAETGDYDQAESLLTSAIAVDDCELFRSLLERVQNRQREDFLIASSYKTFQTGSAEKAAAEIQDGLARYPDSRRLEAVLACYKAYKETPFTDLIYRVPAGMVRDQFALPDGTSLTDCLVFSKFTESSTESSRTVIASPSYNYGILEGTLYAGKYLEADGRIEIYGDEIPLYDSGRIYRHTKNGKDQGIPIRISVSGIEKVTIRAYVYKPNTVASSTSASESSASTYVIGSELAKQNQKKMCTLVMDDLIFHDDLTEEMIWAAADSAEEE